MNSQDRDNSHNSCLDHTAKTYVSKRTSDQSSNQERLASARPFKSAPYPGVRFNKRHTKTTHIPTPVSIHSTTPKTMLHRHTYPKTAMPDPRAPTKEGLPNPAFSTYTRLQLCQQRNHARVE